VAWARRVIEAMGDGSGTVMLEGKMQDDATVKQCRVMVGLAKLIAKRDPEMATAYGFSKRELEE
jgi:malyl-CoA/(S)-citramalyl-CoA lyase